MIVINDITRREFIKLFPKYRSGTYPDMPGIEKVIEHYRGRGIRLEPQSSDEGSRLTFFHAVVRMAS